VPGLAAVGGGMPSWAGDREPRRSQSRALAHTRLGFVFNNCCSALCFLLTKTCYYLSAGLIIHRTWCKMSSCLWSSLGTSGPGRGTVESFGCVAAAASLATQICLGAAFCCSPGWNRGEYDKLAATGHPGCSSLPSPLRCGRSWVWHSSGGRAGEPACPGVISLTWSTAAVGSAGGRVPAGWGYCSQLQQQVVKNILTRALGFFPSSGLWKQAVQGV